MLKAVRDVKARQKGFTVIEIMVVIAVSTILFLTAMSYYQDYANDARLAAVKQNINLINEAISRYFKDHMEYPKTFKDLIDGSYIALSIEQTLKEPLAKLNMNIETLRGQRNPLDTHRESQWVLCDAAANRPDGYFSRIRLCLEGGKTGETPPMLYILTVDGGKGSGSYTEGQTVAVEAGSGFRSWQASGIELGDNALNPTFTFTMPPHDVVLTASHKPLYPLTIIDGGDGATGNCHRAENDEIHIYAGTKLGYEFTHWEVAPTSASLADATAAETTFTMPAEAVTLTAIWKPLYPLAVNGGGDGATGNGNYAENAVIPIRAGTKVGYEFTHWQVAPTSASTYLADANAAETTFTMPAEAVTLTANWQVMEFSVTIINGGNGCVGHESLFKYGEQVTVYAGTKVGYEFSHWEALPTSIHLADENVPETTFTMPAEAVTLTAKWNQLYALTVNGNGSTGSGGSGSYAEGDAVTVNAGTKDGCLFDHWEVAPTSGSLDDANAAETIFTMPAGAVALTAIWKQLYPLTISGGDGATGNGNYAENAVIPIRAGTKVGYEFTHWQVAPTSASTYLADANAAETTFTMPAEAVTLTANWQPMAFSVTIINGGDGWYARSAGHESPFKYGEQVTVYAGTNFSRWEASDIVGENALNPTFTFAMPPHNVVLTVRQMAWPTYLQYKYDPDTNSYIITGKLNTAPADIVIPSVYNDDIHGELAVTSIANYAFASSYKDITSVDIPDSVTSIGQCAFQDCTGLTSITIPNSVTYIEYMTFNNCTGLTEINIPEGVTSIGKQAFYYCTSLTSVTIPDGVTSIGESAFEYCTSLTSITIPNSVTNIESDAFKNCSSLTSVTIPDSVTSTGEYAFRDCTGLTSVTISDGVTCIGKGSFWNCTSLTSITIPDSVTSIKNQAFYGCTGLTEINFTGTKEQWSALDIHKDPSHDWHTGVQAEVVHCSDGDAPIDG